MPAIKDAIVEMLEADPAVAEWATGGVHVHRAPPMEQDDSERRRDRYVVVRVTESLPVHTQDAPSQLTTDRIEASVWASSSRDADEGANRVRKALDGVTREAAGVSVQRIVWLGTVDREVEDASAAEQLIDGSILEFDVGYTVIVPAESPPGSGITPGTVEISATADLNIETGVLQDTNLDGSSLEVGVISSGGKLERTLFYFDLTSIPTGATITAATLDLYVSQVNGGATLTKLYRLIRPTWSETEATWIRYLAASTWTLAGGDYTDTDPAGVSWTPGPADTHNLIDVATLVQEAVDDLTDHAKQLHLLIRNDDETPPVKYIVISGKNAGTVAHRPKLTVSYE